MVEIKLQMNNFILRDTTDIITYPFPILVNLG